ncbi:hypothetical protein MKX07_000380 [Trichoderma sp. CBMAI-0711]|nr:hypothetical protein MKX07_000380 [Trichoderma sp. CBMAI-0711]
MSTTEPLSTGSTTLTLLPPSNGRESEEPNADACRPQRQTLTRPCLRWRSLLQRPSRPPYPQIGPLTTPDPGNMVTEELLMTQQDRIMRVDDEILGNSPRPVEDAAGLSSLQGQGGNHYLQRRIILRS